MHYKNPEGKEGKNVFDFLLSEAARIAQTIAIGKDRITDEQYIVNEINHFKVSQRRKEMLDGEK